MRSWFAFALLLVACGGDDGTASSGTGGGNAEGGSGGMEVEGDPCPAPGRMVGAACLPPGVMDDGCAAGTWAQADGGCAAAGVASCGEGFEPDGSQGCRAVLPDAPCTPPMMAVPGDAACRPIMGCGTGTWGDIPVDASTIFVDASYAGGNSDGSQGAPYTALTTAISAATGGELIAVAAGGYIADFVIDKPLTIHGICPEEVDVLGSPTVAGPALRVLPGGSGTTIVGMRFTDLHVSQGIIVEGATDVTLDRVWLNANITGGVDARWDPVAGSASLTIVDSLIDANGWIGVFAWGSTVVIENTEIRDMQFYGETQAIAVLSGSADAIPSDVTLRGSRVDGGGVFGVHVLGSKASIERSIIQNTKPDPSGLFGRGVNAQYRPDQDLRADVTLRQSVVEDAFGVGLFAASSDLDVEDTIVQRVAPGEEGDGTLVAVQVSSLSGQEMTDASTLSMRSSRLNDAEGGGLTASSAIVELERVIVRDIETDPQGTLGRGLYFRADPAVGEGTEASVRGSIVERTHDVGLITFGSRVEVEGTVVRQTEPDAISYGGRGLSLQYKNPLALPSEVGLVGSVVEDNSDHGVLVFGSRLTMAASVVRSTAPNALGEDGRGLGVQRDPVSGNPGALVLSDSSIENSHGIGLFVSASELQMVHSAVTGTAPTMAGGLGRAVSLQDADGVPTTASLVGSRLLDNHEFGLFVTGATASMDDCEVAGTLGVDVDGQALYGDAIAILQTGLPTQLDVLGSRLHDNTRAGVLYFGGALALGGNELACNGIDLVDGSEGGAADALVNLGDNRCGCPAAEGGCKWQGNQVAPPSPLEDAEAGEDSE